MSLGLRLPPSGPSSSGNLSPDGDGLQPANSVPSFVLCAVLVVSYVRAFHMVAIPQSGLPAQVSSLWLHLGHSGLILEKHCSPHLPAQLLLASCGWRHLHCFSAGRVTIGIVICWFYFFIFPPCYVALCASKARHRLGSESVSWSFKLLSFKTPFPGQSSLPTSFVYFFIFYIFSYLFLETMICFSGCLMSSASIQKLFCEVYSALKCSFEEFVREKVVFPSYSSAIFSFSLCHLHEAVPTKMNKNRFLGRAALSQLYLQWGHG